MKLRPIKVDGSEAWAKLYERAHETLMRRIEEFQPPELVSLTVQDKVIVHRFPSQEKATKVDIGEGKVLHLPDVAQQRTIPFSTGILMFAGAEALDVLASHGILPGDIVRWAYLAGDEEDTARVDEAMKTALEMGLTGKRVEAAGIKARDEEFSKKKLIRLRTSDIHESVDLLERLYGDKPTMEYVREERPDGTFQHVIRPIAENL